MTKRQWYTLQSTCRRFYLSVYALDLFDAVRVAESVLDLGAFTKYSVGWRGMLATDWNDRS